MSVRVCEKDIDGFIDDSLLHSVLASLNLPAALEDTQGVAVPPSVVDKSEALIREGGLEQIDSMIRELPDLLRCNQEILDEVVGWYRASYDK